MKQLITLLIPILTIILIIPLQAEARKNIEDIGISLDRTCLALIKAEMKTNCPTYDEILLIYPDTSNKRISGDFIFKDGMLQRENPQYNNHLNAYLYLPPMIWIDPPGNTIDKIKHITIASSLPLYEINGSHEKKNNTLVLAKDRYVDPKCHTAIISAEKWLVLLGDTINFMQHKCDPSYTKINSLVKIYKEPTKHDITTTAWYKYQQWLKNAKLISKDKFLVIPGKDIYSPKAR